MEKKSNSLMKTQESVNASLFIPYFGTQLSLGWITRKTAMGNVLQFFILIFIGLLVLAWKYQQVVNFILFFVGLTTIYIIIASFTKSDLVHDVAYLLGRKEAPIGDKKTTKLKIIQEADVVDYQPITHIKTVSTRARINNPKFEKNTNKENI